MGPPGFRLPVVVVGDIDRGGVFAALYGTLALSTPPISRISGFVINKFRGHRELPDPPHPDRRADRPSGPRRLLYLDGIWTRREHAIATEHAVDIRPAAGAGRRRGICCGSP